MNLRILALTSFTLAAMAPAAFAAASGSNELCQYQPKNLKDTPAVCETVDHGMTMHGAKVVTGESHIVANDNLTFGGRSDVTMF